MLLVKKMLCEKNNKWSDKSLMWQNTIVIVFFLLYFDLFFKKHGSMQGLPTRYQGNAHNTVFIYAEHISLKKFYFWGGYSTWMTKAKVFETLTNAHL